MADPGFLKKVKYALFGKEISPKKQCINRIENDIHKLMDIFFYERLRLEKEINDHENNPQKLNNNSLNARINILKEKLALYNNIYNQFMSFDLIEECTKDSNTVLRLRKHPLKNTPLLVPYNLVYLENGNYKYRTLDELYEEFSLLNKEPAPLSGGRHRRRRHRVKTRRQHKHRQTRRKN